MGNIYIESKPIPIPVLGLIYDHLYLVYKDDAGSEYIIRGGPQSNSLPFGNLVTQVNVAIESSLDARNGANPVSDRGQIQIDLGARSAADVWGIMQQIASQAQGAALTYDADSQNSNSLISAVLHGIGVDVYNNFPYPSNTSAFSIVAEGNMLNYARAIGGTGGKDLIHGWELNDSLFGGDDTDIIYGELGDDSIFGGMGNDTLYGDKLENTVAGDILGGDDTIWGGNDNDYIYGGGGNDSLSGEDGGDVIWGGNGDDVISGGLDANILYGGAGNDMFIVTGNDTIDGGDGFDTADYSGYSAGIFVTESGDLFPYAGGGIIGHISNIESIIGTAYADRIDTTVANNTIHAGAGADTIFGSYGHDTIDGGDSFDLIHYSTLSDAVTVDLLAGSAVINASTTYTQQLVSIENAYGSVTGDTLYGTNSTNRLWGHVGDDYIDGRDGNDTLYGGLGNDTILGGAGGDIIYGEGGNDYIYDGAGNDSVYGGIGNDTIVAGLGNYNSFDGGDGQDTLVFQQAASVLLEFNQAQSAGGFYSFSGIEHFVFSDEADTIVASGGDYVFAAGGNDDLSGNANDTLMGGDGNDTLTSNYGSNYLDGGTGHDYLEASIYGNDTLIGGAGDDIFDVWSMNPGITSYIMDFEGEGSVGGDLILLPGYNWSLLSITYSGQQASIVINSSTTSTIVVGQIEQALTADDFLFRFI